MLKTQEYLIDLVKSGLTVEQALAELTSGFGIKVRDYDNFVLLDYSMIDSPKMHPIVIECRSLILSKGDWRVLSLKFPRFFNAGECPEYYSDFKVERAIPMMKLDGSLIGVWYNEFDKVWEISTRGMAKAEGGHPMGETFRDKVLGAMGFTEEQFQNFFNNYGNRLITLICEWVSPENRIVTRYEKSQLVLLGISNIFNMAVDSNPGTLSDHQKYFNNLGLKFDTPQVFEQNYLPQLIEAANEMDGLKEGFVLYDPVSSKRMKIKSSNYVLAHRIRGEDTIPTRKNLLELIFTGEVAEFLIYFPEYTDLVTGVETDVETFLDSLDKVWEANKDIENQKEFALALKGLNGTGFLFSARKNKTNPRDEFNATNLLSKQRIFLE
jgi:RNA ligase